MEIMLQLIDIVQLVHSVGYTHNDIKASNIMLNKNLEATLIDFGYSKKYIDKNSNGDNQHVRNKYTQQFKGNILFASPNQMNFRMTSRKDDLFSVSYMMLYLLNREQFPLIKKTFKYEYSSDEGMKEQFIEVQEYKKQFSLYDLSQNLARMEI